MRGEQRRLPPFVLHRYVFDMCGNPPFVAEGVLHGSAAIAVGMVSRFRDRLPTSGYGAEIQLIAVGHVQIEHAFRWLIRSVRVAQLHVGAADLDGRMMDHALGCLVAANLLGVESTLE